MLEVGQTFPAFALPDQNDHIVQLSDLRGKWVVLYVYPKDDTPGCTLEGKGFSAARPNFDQLNAVVFGLSTDDPRSHKRFCDKYGFAISLLADPGGELLRTAGVGQTDWHGTLYWDRTTFLIDPHGTLRKIYTSVKPDGHDKEVLADIESLQR